MAIQVIPNVVGDGLCVRCTPRPAAIDLIMHFGELVGHAIRDIASRRCPRICPNDDTAIVLYCHDRRLGVASVHTHSGMTQIRLFKPQLNSI